MGMEDDKKYIEQHIDELNERLKTIRDNKDNTDICFGLDNDHNIECIVCGHINWESWDYNLNDGDHVDYECPDCNSKIEISASITTTYTSKLPEDIEHDDDEVRKILEEAENFVLKDIEDCKNRLSAIG